MTGEPPVLSRREQDLAKLLALNHSLEHRGVEPLFDNEVAARHFSNRALHKAVKLTEEELIRVTKKLAEQ